MKRDQKISKYQKKINVTKDPIKRSFYVKKLKQYGGGLEHEQAITGIRQNMILAQEMIRRIVAEKNNLKIIIESNKKEIGELKEELSKCRESLDILNEEREKIVRTLTETQANERRINGDNDELNKRLVGETEKNIEILKRLNTNERDLSNLRMREDQLTRELQDNRDKLMIKSREYSKLVDDYKKCLEDNKMMTNAAKETEARSRMLLSESIPELQSDPVTSTSVLPQASITSPEELSSALLGLIDDNGRQPNKRNSLVPTSVDSETSVMTSIPNATPSETSPQTVGTPSSIPDHDRSTSETSQRPVESPTSLPFPGIPELTPAEKETQKDEEEMRLPELKPIEPVKRIVETPAPIIGTRTRPMLDYSTLPSSKLQGGFFSKYF